MNKLTFILLTKLNESFCSPFKMGLFPFNVAQTG